MFSKILAGMIVPLQKNVQVDLVIIFYVFLETFIILILLSYLKWYG